MIKNKITFNTLSNILLLSFLILASLGNPLIQFGGVFLLGLWNMIIFHKSVKIDSKSLFYLIMMVYALIQMFLVWKSDYSLNYLLNSLIASSMWGLMFLASLSLSAILRKMSSCAIDKTIRLLFKIIIVVVIFQYILIAIEKNAIIPYFVSMGTGDYIKGIFSNSSVSMIIFSFYTIYFFFKDEIKLSVVAVICMMATTYMSGIVIFLAITLFMVFWYFKTGLKLKIILGLIVSLYVFSLVSPENISYVHENLTDRVFSETNQARKIISFEQTVKYASSGIMPAIVGAGGGKFSSRTAFLTSGDYVSWYPSNLTYMSDVFKENHYSLWNSELLKKPYMDGTANQPFSFYNKIIGEYGLLGVAIFMVFYLGKWIKNYKKLTYGKYILLLMLGYFVLDYWFEYFTVILFFELFIALDFKDRKDDFRIQ